MGAFALVTAPKATLSVVTVVGLASPLAGLWRPIMVTLSMSRSACPGPRMCWSCPTVVLTAPKPTRRAGTSAVKLSTSGNSVRVTSCSLRVLFTKGGYTGGGNGMNYAGYFWRTLGGANPHDRSIRCENHWRNIPAGCSVATNCGWIQHVARSYWWGTHVLQGRTCSYGTRTYTNGRHFGGGCGISGNRAKTNGCSLRVILQCKTRL